MRARAVPRMPSTLWHPGFTRWFSPTLTPTSAASSMLTATSPAGAPSTRTMTLGIPTRQGCALVAGVLAGLFLDGLVTDGRGQPDHFEVA